MLLISLFLFFKKINLVIIIIIISRHAYKVSEAGIVIDLFILLLILQETKILLRVYLTNRLELDAHIFTQGKYGTLDVPFGGLVDFGLGGSIFGAKNYVFGNKSCTRRISGTAWI